MRQARAAQVGPHLQGGLPHAAGSGHQGALSPCPPGLRTQLPPGGENGVSQTAAPRGLWAAEGARI